MTTKDIVDENDRESKDEGAPRPGEDYIQWRRRALPDCPFVVLTPERRAALLQAGSDRGVISALLERWLRDDQWPGYESGPSPAEAFDEEARRIADKAGEGH